MPHKVFLRVRNDRVTHGGPTALLDPTVTHAVEDLSTFGNQLLVRLKFESAQKSANALRSLKE